MIAMFCNKMTTVYVKLAQMRAINYQFATLYFILLHLLCIFSVCMQQRVCVLHNVIWIKVSAMV
jgi:hypothetical protein